MADLVTILPITLAFEGGWADNPKDPGGATMKGITFTTFKQFFPKGTVTQLRYISDSDTQHIYDVGYFEPILGSTLSQGVGMVAFDYGVNSGVSRVKNILASTAKLFGVARVKAISDARLSFLHALTTWKYFGPGWGKRVGEAEAQGIKWESLDAQVASVQIKKAAVEVRKTSQAHTTAVVASASAAAPTIAVQEVQQVHFALSTNLLILTGLALVVIICGLIAFHSSQRAAALESKS